jgi:hypothetical protein
MQGYTRKCKDRIAGIKSIWLLKYVKYGRSEIITSGNNLISFPETFVFKFESLQNPSANENQQQNEGGKYFEQSISMTFSNAEIAEIELLQKIDVRMLVLDNNGLYKIYGLWNGLQGGNITYTTGNSKSDLNGFKIDFNGLEENESAFVENPFGIGFIEEGFDYYLDFIMYG